MDSVVRVPPVIPISQIDIDTISRFIANFPFIEKDLVLKVELAGTTATIPYKIVFSRTYDTYTPTCAKIDVQTAWYEPEV